MQHNLETTTTTTSLTTADCLLRAAAPDKGKCLHLEKVFPQPYHLHPYCLPSFSLSAPHSLSFYSVSLPVCLIVCLSFSLSLSQSLFSASLSPSLSLDSNDEMSA